MDVCCTSIFCDRLVHNETFRLLVDLLVKICHPALSFVMVSEPSASWIIANVIPSANSSIDALIENGFSNMVWLHKQEPCWLRPEYR